MEKQKKKEILAEYKERTVIGGVYIIKNTVNDNSVLFSATDLQGSQNRFNFAKKTGSCVHVKLQADWTEFGPDVFTFEIIEELKKKEGQTAKEFSDDIKLLEKIWIEKLNADL